MGVTAKETEVRLTSDATRLKKGYSDAASATNKLTKTIEDKFKNVKRTIATAFSAVIITKFFKDAGQVAIDAEETFQKFGIVFEDVVKDAALAAEDLTENYGLSEIAAKKLLASTGDLLTGLGAQDDQALALSSTVQKLSVDISSFQNLQGGATQASEIITKAMLGERDALTTLGVKILESDVQHELMRRGQEKLTGQALLLAKAQITLSGIISQSGKAINDYSRTSESAANVLRRLGNQFENFQVAIGNSIIKSEGFKKALGGISSLLMGSEFSDIITGMIDAFGNAVSTVIDLISDNKDLLVGTFELMADVFKVIIESAGLVVDAIRRIAQAAKDSFPFVIDLLEMIAEGWGKLADLAGNVKEFENQTEKITESFRSMEYTAKRAQDKFTLFFRSLDTDSFIKLREAMGTIPTDFKDGGDMAHFFNSIMNDIVKGKHGEKLANEYKAFNKELKSAGEAEREFTDFFKVLNKEVNLNEAEMGAFIAAIGDTGREFRTAGEKGAFYQGILKNIEEGMFGPTVRQAMSDWRIATKGLSKETGIITGLTKEQKKAVEAAAKAYEKLAGSMGILTDKGIVDQSKEIKSLLKLYKENEDQVLGNNEVTEKWIDSIDELAKTALPEEKKALENILTALKLTVEEEEDFSDSIDALNTNILPEATIEFQKLEDKIKDTGEETEDSSSKFAELADGIARVGISAAGLLNQLGILGDEGAEIAGDLFSSFAGGAAAFAQFSSGDILGGIESAIGAIGSLASAFSSLFGGESGEMEATKRRLQGLVGVTDEWAEKIEKAAQELGGAESTERAFNAALAEIISTTEISTNNFDAFITKTREIISVFERGNASAEETAKNFGAAFAEMAKAAEDMGVSGGVAITGLIIQAEQLGLNIKEVAEFIEEKDIKAFDNWKKAVEAFGGASIPIFDEMTRKEEIMALIPDSIKSGIEGLTGALVNLSDAHRLTGEEFDVFEDKTMAALEALEASGVKGFDAIEPMKELLNRLAFLQDEYGFAVDDSIQALIDEGKASGEITGSIMSDSEKQIALQERMVDALERLSDGFFGVTKSIDSMGQAGERMAGRMNDDLSKTQRNLSGIADTINTDVVNALGNMGDASDDVMWKNSIIPDLQDWQKEIENVKEKIANDLIMSMLDMGKTYDEIQKEINENPLLQGLNLDSIRDEFESLFDDITDGAKIGSKALFEMMEAGENLGFGVEIEAFKKENLEKALESFTDIKDIGKIDLREIRKEIRETEKELVGMREGSLAFDQIQDKLDGLKQKLSDTTAAQRVFGDLSIGVLDDMFRLQEKVGKNETLVNGIKSAISLLGDFSKAENLSKSEFQDFEDIATKSFNELLTAGFTRKQAFNTIAPLLEQLDFLDKEFDLSIDGITRGLIKEGKKLGEVGEIQKSEQEKMIDQMGITNQLLSQLVEGLGIEVPNAIRDSIKDLADMQINANANMVGVPELITPSIQDIQDTTSTGFNLTDPGAPSFDIEAGDATSPVSKTVTIDMKISAADVNPVVLAEKIKFIITDNTQGVTDVIAKV